MQRLQEHNRYCSDKVSKLCVFLISLMVICVMACYLLIFDRFTYHMLANYCFKSLCQWRLRHGCLLKTWSQLKAGSEELPFSLWLSYLCDKTTTQTCVSFIIQLKLETREVYVYPKKKKTREVYDTVEIIIFTCQWIRDFTKPLFVIIIHS